MLQLFTQSSGYFVPDTDKPANLISNEYFPFIHTGRMDICSSYFENSISTYYKPSITKDVRVKTNSSVNILNALTYSESIYKFVFTSSTYFIGKGIIMDAKGEILLLTTVKRELFKDYDIRRRELSEDNGSDFSYNNFVMFISSELAFKEEHSVFYRRLQKIYLNFCFEKGMEVRFLPSSTIEKNTFANSLNLRFNSIDQLDYHLRNEVKNFLLISDEDVQQRSLHINIPPVNIVIPVAQPIVDSEEAIDLSYLEEDRINRQDAELRESTEASDRDASVESAQIAASISINSNAHIQTIVNGIDDSRSDMFRAVGVPSSYLSQDTEWEENPSNDYIGTYTTQSAMYNMVAGVDPYMPEPPVETTLLPPEEPTTELEDPDIIII